MPVFRVPAAITWNQAGAPGANVWSVRTNEASVIADELDAALGALQAFYTALSDHWPSGMKVTLGPDIIERTSAEDHSRPSRTVTAIGTDTPAPPALQLCVSWRTTLRARRAMGRTFIGPLKFGVVDTLGTPSPTLITEANAAAQALLDASTAATGWAVGVWGLQDPGVYDDRGNLVPGQPHVHRDYVSFKIKDQFAILRSRRD